MTKYQGKSKKLISGGRRRSNASKKKRELGRPPVETHIAETRKRIQRTMGGNRKFRLYRENKVNIVNIETGKATSGTISNVTHNPASRDFTRRRIITKGAIIDTNLGKAKVTNRPGSEGFVNAILVTE
ncbi:MAG: 30S ribosomal protein S8e [Candidatus Heimdallarchaeota archaeon]|nr:30S ribosomal protein S8e [Candidatus Heimdallarchaeota archaeon]